MLGIRLFQAGKLKIEGNKVWVNVGSDAVAVGDELNVMSKGEELIDPDTGISLGSSDTKIGSVRVDTAQEKFSIASVVGMNGKPKRGDKVVSTAPPPSIEFASNWKKPKRGQF